MCFQESKVKSALAAVTPPQTPLGELTALPDPLAGLRGEVKQTAENEA